MQSIRTFIFCLFVLLAFSTSSIQARALWGVVGHALVASIAQTLLDSYSTQQALTLLPANKGQMSAVSSWADQVRSQPEWEWTGPLHYINTPDWACYYDPSTDCPDNMCVAGAISNYTVQLANPNLSFNNSQDAFKFVIHFIGDIHQPLHVSFGSDKGGNSLIGTYFGNQYNLHDIWDNEIIAGRIKYDFGGSQNSYFQYLLSLISGSLKDKVKTWATCNGTSTVNSNSFACPDEWATESAKQACTYAYTDQNGNKIENGFSLAGPYYEYVKNVVDQQLIKGGVRLAATLNTLWQQ